MTIEMIALEGTTQMKLADIKNQEDKHIIGKCLALVLPPDRHLWNMKSVQRSVYIIVDKETNELIDGSMGIKTCKHFSPESDTVPVWLLDHKKVDEVKRRIAKEYGINDEGSLVAFEGAALIEMVEGEPFEDFLRYIKNCLRLDKDKSKNITDEELQFLNKFYEQALDNSHIFIEGETDTMDNHYTNNCHCNKILKESIKEFISSNGTANLIDIIKANLLRYDMKNLGDKYCNLVELRSKKEKLNPEFDEIHYLISKCLTHAARINRIISRTDVNNRDALKEVLNKMSEEEIIKYKESLDRAGAVEISRDGKVKEMTREEAFQSLDQVWEEMIPEERIKLIEKVKEPEQKEYQLKDVNVREMEVKTDPMSFDEFFGYTDDGIRSALLKDTGINSQVRLYSKSKQSVTIFAMLAKNQARDIPKAVHTILKSHWYDYYAAISEGWMSIDTDRKYELGELTKLPRNEKKEVLTIKAGSKRDGLRHVLYEIIRENPEDDTSKVLRFEKLEY